MERKVFSGEEGFFVGDGTSLSPMAVVGDPLSGGGTINEIFEDFAYSKDVFDIIATPSSGVRGIYSSSATGFSQTVEFGQPAPGGGVFSTNFFVARQEDTLAFQAVFTNGRRGIYLAEASTGRAEIIGNWSNGIWYWDVAESEWTQMSASTPTGDIAAGDFSGDGIAGVASILSTGLWYQDGDTLGLTKVSDSVPDRLTAGDVTGE